MNTALMMLLLPVVYLGLVALAGWGVYYWATHGYVVILFRGGGLFGMILKLVIYIGPWLGGGDAKQRSGSFPTPVKMRGSHETR